MNNIVIFIAILILGCNNNLDKYYFDSSEFAQELPAHLIDTSTVFSIKINRDIRLKNWKTLIEKAESCFPPKEEIIKYDNKNTFNDTIKDPMWWYKREAGIKIPYAITGNAINYYLNIINNSINDKNGSEDILTVKSAHLKYTANVKHYESFNYINEKYENVYAVDMYLVFSCLYAFGEGMGFTLSRLAIFSEKEYKLLEIFGDHYTNVSTFHR